MPVRCRMMNGLREMAQVYDLSSHGCCLILRALRPVVGMRLVLKTPGLEGISGIIRWARDYHCGVEFDIPIYQPVVDHLCREFYREAQLAASAGLSTQEAAQLLQAGAGLQGGAGGTLSLGAPATRLVR